MSTSESSTAEPKETKNIYQQFIQDYYAKKPHYKVAPDIPKEDWERVLNERRNRLWNSWNRTMPVMPKEDEVEKGLTDKVAKESKDSTASSHDMHKEGGKAHILDHHATPGPVIAENIGKPASKEELKARAAELNK